MIYGIAGAVYTWIAIGVFCQLIKVKPYRKLAALILALLWPFELGSLIGNTFVEREQIRSAQKDLVQK